MSITSDQIFSAQAPDWDLYRAGFSTFSDCARDLMEDYTPEQILEQRWEITETTHPFSPEQKERTWHSSPIQFLGSESARITPRVSVLWTVTS